MRFLGQIGVRPEFAGPRKPALDFVVDEHGAYFCAAVAEREQEFVIRHIDTSLALDGLDDDTARLVCDEQVDAVNIVVCCVFEAWEHGRERLLVFGIRCCAERAHCAAVEGALEADDLVFGAILLYAASVFPSELDSCLVRLTAAIADERPTRILHSSSLLRLLHEKLAQRSGPWVVVEIARVHQCLRLLVQDPAHLLVAVAQRVHGDAGGEVEVLPVLDVPEVAALAFVEDGRWPHVGGHHVGCVGADETGGLRVRGWVGCWEGRIFLSTT